MLGKKRHFWKLLDELFNFGVVAIEKGAFGSPLTKVANFTFYLTEFDMHIDIVLIVYMFCTKILFFFFLFKGWCEKIVKSGDFQGGITNKQIIIIIIIYTWIT